MTVLGTGGAMFEWDADVDDAATFDSPPGVGFDSHPVAAAIVPPRPPTAEAAPGGGPCTKHSFKALNRAGTPAPRSASCLGPRRVRRRGYDRTLSGHGLSGSARSALVSDLGLRTERSGAAGTRFARTRLGLYRPWNPSMDEGWTRWLLEAYDFEFSSLRNADVLAGDLRDRYDVIIVADMGSGQILNGFARGTVPPRYEGGIGAVGVRALDAFVRGGGTLVTFNNASMSPCLSFTCRCGM